MQVGLQTVGTKGEVVSSRGVLAGAEFGTANPVIRNHGRVTFHVTRWVQSLALNAEWLFLYKKPKRPIRNSNTAVFFLSFARKLLTAVLAIESFFAELLDLATLSIYTVRLIAKSFNKPTVKGGNQKSASSPVLKLHLPETATDITRFRWA